MKRIFRDLFERQCFEDDGVFDWDIIKKTQQLPSDLIAGAVGAAMGGGDLNNPESIRTTGQPGMEGGSGGPEGGASNPKGAGGGASSAFANPSSGGGLGPKPDMGDGTGDDKQGGDPSQRRSIISSIR